MKRKFAYGARVKGNDVGESVFGSHRDGDVTVERLDPDIDTAAMEHRKSVLQSHPELADNPWVPAFLGVLLLGEVLISHTAASVADRPGAIAEFDD